MAESNRRNFFRQAAAEAVKGAREVIPLVDPLASLAETPPTAAPSPVAQGQRTEPATPTGRAASVEEMLAIAAELGLGARAEDLRRLAVLSTRLTPAADSGGSSFAGGEPTIPATVEVPELESGPARFVALLDLPGGGRLWLFGSDPGNGDADPADTSDVPPPEVAAVYEQTGVPVATDPIPLPPGATPLSPSPELTLPRPRSAAAESLALLPSEQTAWNELRTRLAAAQGVPLGEGAPPHAAIHRIGGYPDERRDDMPLICELRLLGVDLEGKPPATHPLAGALEGETGNWRLVAQLGSDDDLGWTWGPRYQRLYVWAQVGDSAAVEYDSLQVVIE